MDVSDILYTPLDVPPCPDFDVAKLRQWIANLPTQETVAASGDQFRVQIVKEINTAKASLNSWYPWNTVWVKQDNIWLNGFEKEFPQVARYMYEAFGLTNDEIPIINLLPLKNDFAGIGFWHSDPDELGLRLYLENDCGSDTSVLFKPFVEKHYSRIELGQLPRDGKTDLLQQDVMHEVVTPPGRSATFINNLSAMHAVNTKTPGNPRIAVIIGVQRKYMTLNKINDLIIRSANKFKDQAVIWTPPK